MLLHGLVDRLTGKNTQAWKEGKIRGTAVLVKSDVLNLGDFHASLLDGVHDILGKDDGVIFHLVSATAPDPRKLYFLSLASFPFPLPPALALPCIRRSLAAAAA